jgi:hypothetical protein
MASVGAYRQLSDTGQIKKQLGIKSNQVSKVSMVSKDRPLDEVLRDRVPAPPAVRPTKCTRGFCSASAVHLPCDLTMNLMIFWWWASSSHLVPVPRVAVGDHFIFSK